MTTLQCAIVAAVVVVAAIIGILGGVEFSLFVMRATGRHDIAERLSKRLEPFLRYLRIVR